MMFQTSLDASI